MYTKQQRNEIYKKAYDSLLNVDTNRLGLCWAVNVAGCLDGYDYNFKNLPEISLRNPNTENNRWFSLDLDGKQKRIEILKQAIAETED